MKRKIAMLLLSVTVVASTLSGCTSDLAGTIDENTKQKVLDTIKEGVPELKDKAAGAVDELTDKYKEMEESGELDEIKKKAEDFIKGIGSKQE